MAYVKTDNERGEDVVVYVDSDGDVLVNVDWRGWVILGGDGEGGQLHLSLSGLVEILQDHGAIGVDDDGGPVAALAADPAPVGDAPSLADFLASESGAA